MMLNLTYRSKPTRSDRVILFLLDVGFFVLMVGVYGWVALGIWRMIRGVM